MKKEAENFIFIYGGYDPWSAAAADPGDNDGCMKIVREEGCTRHPDKKPCPTEQKELVFSKLEEWLESPVVTKER